MSVCVFCSTELTPGGTAVRVQDALCGVALDSVHRDRTMAADDVIAYRLGLRRAYDLHETSLDVTDDLDLQIERALLR